MIHDNVSLAKALPPALAMIVPFWVWVLTIVPVVWSLVRLKRPGGMLLAGGIVATFAIFMFTMSAVGWVASPMLVLAGYALFRRPPAATTIICVGAWTIATWTNWGWETLYEEAGTCIFPGAWVLHTGEYSEGAVRCELPLWT
jgi:hypothetical protein